MILVLIVALTINIINKLGYPDVVTLPSVIDYTEGKAFLCLTIHPIKMKHRESRTGRRRLPYCAKQLEDIVSTIESEKPMERIQTLEEKINEVDKIQSIENSIRQLKNHLWVAKEVLSSSEACDYLEISESHLYRLTSSKQIPHYKPNGKMIFFNRKELCEWVMRNPAQMTDVQQSKKVSL